MQLGHILLPNQYEKPNPMTHQLLSKVVEQCFPSSSNLDTNTQKFIQLVNKDYCFHDQQIKEYKKLVQVAERQNHQIDCLLKEEINHEQNALMQLIQCINNFHTDVQLEANEHTSFETVIDYFTKEIKRKNDTENNLIQAKEIAEKAAYARSEFLSMMSHEIRTPLNAVIGTTYLLIEDAPSPKQFKQLSMLKSSAEDLMRLINDILDYSKIEADKIDLEKKPFDLIKLLNHVKNSNIVKAEQNKNNIRLLIDTSIPPLVIGDSLRIGQVVTNLVSNAVKFTQNGLVTVEALLVAKKTETVTIAIHVKDNGIGIAKADHEKIFEKFTQANEYTTRKYGGTGLGLAISSKLLERMDSKLNLKSELGEGSNFSFEISLPYEKGDHEIINSDPVIESNDLFGLKILLAEDNEYNSIIATTFLENWNANVDIAWNGKEAVEMALKNNYDVVLMDLQMPVMNGYDATTKILTQKPNLPIVALTASALHSIIDKAFESGMIAYVTKPFEPQQLCSTILKHAVIINSKNNLN